jgi:hypothetical protein
MVGVFVYYAALVEGKGLKGVVPLVDGYLRYSSVIGIAIALATGLVLFFDFELTKNLLGPLVCLLVADISVAVVVSVTGTGLIVNAYKKSFQSRHLLLVAEEYERTEHCCGWASDSSQSGTRPCEWQLRCDQVFEGYFSGKQSWLFRGLLLLALALDIYVLAGHILFLSDRSGNYDRLVSTEPTVSTRP